MDKPNKLVTHGPVEGVHVPPVLWRCWCGRRYRTWKGVCDHHDRGRCKVASGFQGGEARSRRRALPSAQEDSRG